MNNEQKQTKEQIDVKQKELVKSIIDENTPDDKFLDDLLNLCTLNKLSDTLCHGKD